VAISKYLSKYDKEAGSLQSKVRASEVESEVYYDENRVKKAIVHGREDIVLMVSYLSSVNEQLGEIRKLLWGLAALLAIIVIYK
jgi:hypothetical protein